MRYALYERGLLHSNGSALQSHAVMETDSRADAAEMCETWGEDVNLIVLDRTTGKVAQWYEFLDEMTA